MARLTVEFKSGSKPEERISPPQRVLQLSGWIERANSISCQIERENGAERCAIAVCSFRHNDTALYGEYLAARLRAGVRMTRAGDVLLTGPCA
jgi:hypothetical protein